MLARSVLGRIRRRRMKARLKKMKALERQKETVANDDPVVWLIELF